MAGQRWAPYWRQDSKLDGHREFIMWEGGQPLLFRSKRECQAWIKREYGYIAKRADLRREPHCWRMPQPVRVEITLSPNNKGN